MGVLNMKWIHADANAVFCTWRELFCLQYSAFVSGPVNYRSVSHRGSVLRSPGWTRGCLIHLIRSPLEGCVRPVPTAGMKVLSKWSGRQYGDTLCVCVCVFLLVSTIRPRIRQNGLFVSRVISATSKRTHTYRTYLQRTLTHSSHSRIFG